MFKRLFFAMLGLGCGVVLGALVVRRIGRTRRQLAPDALARSVATRAGGAAARMGDAVRAGRATAARREAELRAHYLGEPLPDPKGARP